MKCGSEGVKSDGDLVGVLSWRMDFLSIRSRTQTRTSSTKNFANFADLA